MATMGVRYIIDPEGDVDILIYDLNDPFAPWKDGTNRDEAGGELPLALPAPQQVRELPRVSLKIPPTLICSHLIYF